jgi:hypothetical protein
VRAVLWTSSAIWIVGCAFDLEAPRSDPGDGSTTSGGAAGSAGVLHDSGGAGAVADALADAPLDASGGAGAGGAEAGSADASDAETDVTPADGAGGAGGCTGRCGDSDCGVCPTRPLIRSRGVAIEATEVTAAEYARFLDASPRGATGAASCSSDRDRKPSCAWPPTGTDADQPVRCVSECDAAAYCTWSKRRLCGGIAGASLTTAAEALSASSSEWTIACTDGGRAEGPWGALGWQPGICQDAARGEDGPRASGPTNFCQGATSGVFDLVGNVREWIAGCSGGECFALGGSFETTRPTCATLHSLPPTTEDLETGFRCCTD